VLTIFWRRVTTLIERHPLLILVDLTISSIPVTLTGGSWISPYYLYSLTSLLTASFFLHIKGVLAAAGYLSILYTIGLFFNEKTLFNIVRLQDFDILLSSYLAFFIVAIFFGYPAHIIRKIDKAEEDTVIAEDSLRDTKELIEAVVDPSALSCKELEVLTSLSEGKTNAQIAEELHIAEKTVKNHLYRIYKKLGIHTREEAIIYYHDNWHETTILNE
jgi:DNA-binding CsgD family transcriptional regulator